MKPTLQTKFSLFYSDGRRLNYGNCLVACFASILEVPIDEVPNLYVFYGLDKNDNKDITNHFWFTVMDKWLNLKHNKKVLTKLCLLLPRHLNQCYIFFKAYEFNLMVVLQLYQLYYIIKPK